MTEMVLTGIEAGYKGTDVLRGIDLTVLPGDCIGVLGPNGAGKSTLLKTISGQLKVRSGSRVIDGVDTTSWPSHRVARAGVRWTGDPRPIFRDLTIAENLEIGASTLKSSYAERSQFVFDLLPVLAERRTAKAATLSGGQQQMLAIGQALMSNPRYLCLDEPSLGLAVHVINSLSEVIGGLAEAGVGIVWAEQFPEVALKRCNRIIVISAGQVVLEDSPSNISSEQLERAYLGHAGH
jgi:branched-chain amino acid transport system ATP-binding protein